MPATIRFEGLESLMGKIESLQQVRMIAAGIKTAALHIKGKIAQYPPVKRLTRASVYGSSFQTDKQRRYFFYALAKGKIEVPYRRGESPGSRTLGRRWTIATSNNGLTAIVGNNAPYGRWCRRRTGRRCTTRQWDGRRTRTWSRRNAAPSSSSSSTRFSGR